MDKFFLINNTMSDCHYGCCIVVKNILDNLEKRNAKCIGEMFVGDYEITEKVDRFIRECDFVIVNGEGTLHDARKKAVSLLLAGVKAKICYKKKVYLINASYMNNSKYMMNLLKYYDGIYVRDVYSFQEIKENNIDVRKMPDMTFYSRYKEMSKEKKYDVLVTDSVLPNVSLKLGKYCNSNNGKWEPLIRNKCQLDLERFLLDIASSKFMLTGRYHGVCLAIQKKIPFLAVESNIKKIEALLCELGMKDRLVPLSYVNNEMAIPGYTVQEYKNIELYIESAYKEIEKVFDEIVSDYHKNK